MRNEIYFRRCGKVILTPGHNCYTESGQIEAIIQDAGHYGFSLSPNVLSCLTTKTKDELSRFRSRILELMQFVSRPAENRVIEAGSTEEFKRIFTSLMRSPSVFSEQDKQDIRWFIVHCLNYDEYVPPIIANPANRAVVAALLIQNNVLASMSVLYRHILSATDVLRIGCALSGANPALTDKIFFHSFSRKERAIMMELLECCDKAMQEMEHRRSEWKQFAKYINPVEYSGRYPYAAQCFLNLKSETGTKANMLLSAVQ